MKAGQPNAEETVTPEIIAKCPECGSTDMTLFDRGGETFLHCSDDQKHLCWVVETAQDFAKFFAAALAPTQPQPSAEELARRIAYKLYCVEDERWATIEAMEQIILAELRSKR